MLDRELVTLSSATFPLPYVWVQFHPGALQPRPVRAIPRSSRGAWPGWQCNSRECGSNAMPRRPAKVTQADIARAIRAAKAAGAGEVTVDEEGVIRIALVASAAPIKPTNGHDQEWTPSEALQRFLKRTESG